MYTIGSVQALPHTSAFVSKGTGEALQKVLSCIMSVMSGDIESALAESCSSVYKDRRGTLATLRKDDCHINYDSNKGWVIFCNPGASVEVGNNALLKAIAKYCASK